MTSQYLSFKKEDWGAWADKVYTIYFVCGRDIRPTTEKKTTSVNKYIKHV